MRAPRKILVADHKGPLDHFVCKVLGHERFFIFHAETVYDFEKILYTEQPEIIIVSAHLPAIDIPSLATLRQRRSKFGINPYLILAVQRDGDRFLQQGIQRFADEVMIAPFYGYELVKKINSADAELRRRELTLLPPPAPVVSDIQEPVSVQPIVSQVVPEVSLPKPIKLKVPQKISVQNPSISLSAVPPSQTSSVVRKKATVLTARIHEFDQLMEDLDQHQCEVAVKEIYRILHADIIRLGGRVASMQGDTVVAVFNNSTLFPNHRIHALQAAMQMQLSAIFFGEKVGGAKGAVNLSLSCVLHTAMLTIMEQGPQRQEITIVGAVLPLAFRILDQSEPGSILATKDCYGEISGYLKISEEYLLEDLSGGTALGFARISAVDTRSFAMTNTPIFQIA